MTDNSTAKKYNNIKLFWGITEAIVSFILLFIFIYLGYSTLLEKYLNEFTSNKYLILVLFTLVVGFAHSILFAPLNYYTDFYLEHKYNLSNQTFVKWLWENLKGTLVGLVIGLPLLLLFYLVLLKFGHLWWLPFSILMFIVSVLLAQILPIIILPIFYKVTPIEDEELKERIIQLSKDAGLKVENVFKFNMSKNTKKANAAFTGLGKTKRIILGDTLLENYTIDEIETVIAHELGHYKLKHIQKNILIGTASSFLIFYLIAQLHVISLNWFGFSNIFQISSLPLLILWAAIVGLFFQPLTNWLSRKFEYEADAYAIKSTNKKDSFINTLEKLTDQNLGDKEPHPFVEWFFYSHPSIKKRIAHLNSL
ncbi:M48 family metallopeptidase [Stygiobacter electus]|jgi:STE24 endopeptidase|uniref:M48 family metallopeptidase n=1 Tax=Stygiobacter electus TaxID=3032292 RepID=A0AAE3P333_9BACT|nr:M48 family metallopeptidase [Stygiobacter electus]MDF1612877.1 M48 family metallopeptidase [Stygiobacter electus]